MALGNFTIRMVDITKGSGNITKWMVLPSYTIKMGRSPMKVIGRRTNFMGEVRSLMIVLSRFMVHSTTGILLSWVMDGCTMMGCSTTTRGQVSEPSNYPTGRFLKGASKMIRLRGQENSTVLKVMSLRVSGETVSFAKQIYLPSDIIHIAFRTN